MKGIDTDKRVTPAALSVLDAARSVVTRHPVTSATVAAGIGGLVLGAALTAIRHRRDAVAVVIAIGHTDIDADTLAPNPPPSAEATDPTPAVPSTVCGVCAPTSPPSLDDPFGDEPLPFTDTSPFEEDDEEGDLR